MEKKSIKINFVFNTIKTIMVVIFPLISFPYISRVLGVDGVGKVQYCTSVIAYFVLFASLGIGTYSIREGVKARSDQKAFSKFLKEIFTINMITTAAAYSILILLFAAGFFQGKRDIMFVCSFSILGTTLSIDWLYQLMERYVYISIRTIILQMAALFMMFYFVRNEEDVLIYAVITVFASKGYCFLNFFQAWKYFDFKTRIRLELKKHIRPILIIFGATLSVSIYMNMDVVMLGMFCGDYQVGIYSAAVKVNVVVKNILTSISAVLMPRLIAYLAKGEHKKYKELFKQGVSLNLFFSVPSAIGLAILSRQIILLFSGRDFLPGVLTGQILAVRLVFSALDNIFYNQVLIPNGREREACIGTIAGAVANLILNAVLIPMFQAEGAAVATVISEGVVFFYFVKFTKNIISLRMIFEGTGCYIIAAVIMGCWVYGGLYVVESAVLQLFILVPTGVMIYVLAWWVMNKKVRKAKTD
ncbi:MAG: flippase [Dorea sp.]|jgi:O-antigen/teichoic acid export membrane protein|nr:flippase [Dorea sp.]